MTKKFTHILNVVVILLFASMNLLAQTKTGSINGQIKTSDGKPAAYVSVGLKNTTKTTLTSDEGTFSLKNVSQGKYVIKISAVGIKSQEKEIIVSESQYLNQRLN